MSGSPSIRPGSPRGPPAWGRRFRAEAVIRRATTGYTAWPGQTSSPVSCGHRKPEPRGPAARTHPANAGHRPCPCPGIRARRHAASHGVRTRRRVVVGCPECGTSRSFRWSVSSAPCGTSLYSNTLPMLGLPRSPHCPHPSPDDDRRPTAEDHLGTVTRRS